ncbi:hypothetical protein MUK42_09742, partial [Musa troglodytarum]
VRQAGAVGRAATGVREAGEGVPPAAVGPDVLRVRLRRHGVRRLRARRKRRRRAAARAALLPPADLHAAAAAQ